MYKNLKQGLEAVVSQLNIGDGIVIEHKPDFYADRTIGYIDSINSSYVILTQTRESKLFLETIFGHFFGTETRYYDSFENVRIVDPVKKG